jgi:acyl carrier protein
VKNDVSKELDFKELQQLAAEILGVDVANVQLNKSFAKDLAADSLDLVELIAAVEDKYDVELSEERLESMKNIGDLWTFLEEEQGGGPRGGSAEHGQEGGRPPSAQAKKQEV